MSRKTKFKTSEAQRQLALQPVSFKEKKTGLFADHLRCSEPVKKLKAR